MVMINESNLLNIVFVYAILHAIMGSGPQIRVADNERMIDPKALFSPKLNYSRQQHNWDWRATTFYPRLPPKFQFGAKKTFNLMMTAIEKHHSGVINCWIWRATVFSCLAPVEWDFVGHLIRRGACGGAREEEAGGWVRMMLRILVANFNRKQVWPLCRWEGPVTFWWWLECCVVRVLMTIHYAIPGCH